MATEPITLFSGIVDPVHAYRVLKKVSPKLEVDGDEQNWRKATVSMGMWPFRKRLHVGHDPAHYSEPNWSVQMDGMRGYFSQFPDLPQRARVLGLTHRLKFSLGTIIDPDLTRDDYRLTVIQILATELQAVWFTPSALRDASGRVLFGVAASEIDPKAKWPSYAA